MDHHSAPSRPGRQVQRRGAGGSYPLDRLLSLDQWPGFDSGGYVQRLAGTERSLPEPFHSPAHSNPRLPARSHGNARRSAQPPGARLCAGHRPGRPDRVSRPGGALRPGRRHYHFLAPYTELHPERSEGYWRQLARFSPLAVPFRSRYLRVTLSIKSIASITTQWLTVGTGFG